MLNCIVVSYIALVKIRQKGSVKKKFHDPRFVENEVYLHFAYVSVVSVDGILCASFVPRRCLGGSSVLLLPSRVLDMYDSIGLVLELLAKVNILRTEKFLPGIETESNEILVTFRDAMLGDDSEAVLRNSLGVALALVDNDDFVVRVVDLCSGG